jgi:hypothetical protein
MVALSFPSNQHCIIQAAGILILSRDLEESKLHRLSDLLDNVYWLNLLDLVDRTRLPAIHRSGTDSFVE